MRKTRDKKLDEYVIDLLKGSGMKPLELSKHLIIYKAYYKEVKEALDKDKVTFLVRKVLISSFIQFVVEFEMVCIDAYNPLKGSQSTANDIINMYSKRHRIELEKELKK